VKELKVRKQGAEWNLAAKTQSAGSQSQEASFSLSKAPLRQNLSKLKR